MNISRRWFAAVLIGLCVLSSTSQAQEDKPARMRGGDFEVEVVPDVSYDETKDGDREKHKLDLYLPKGHKDYPVLLFVHGGGWTKGDRKAFAKLGQVFAKNGVGTVVSSYRLTPEVRHPGHIEDVARAFAWTYKNIAKYGGAGPT